jgi:hypothetical protein
LIGDSCLQPLGAERLQEHDPEKWRPVFRKDHAPTKISMIRKSGGRFSEKDHAPTKISMIRKSGRRFSEKIMLKQIAREGR